MAPKFPVLTCDFFLWGYLKGRVCTPKPRNLNELKDAIRQEVLTIDQQLLARAMDNFKRRTENCEPFTYQRPMLPGGSAAVSKLLELSIPCQAIVRSLADMHGGESGGGSRRRFHYYGLLRQRRLVF